MGRFRGDVFIIREKQTPRRDGSLFFRGDVPIFVLLPEIDVPPPSDRSDRSGVLCFPSYYLCSQGIWMLRQVDTSV